MAWNPFPPPSRLHIHELRALLEQLAQPPEFSDETPPELPVIACRLPLSTFRTLFFLDGPTAEGTGAGEHLTAMTAIPSREAPSLELINLFNYEFRPGRLSLDNEGDPFLYSTIPAGNLAPAALAQWVAEYDALCAAACLYLALRPQASREAVFQILDSNDFPTELARILEDIRED